MDLFVTGTYAELIALVAFLLLVFFALKRAEMGHVPTVRPLPQLEGIREAVRRSAELNRPVVFPPGGAAVAGVVSATISGDHLASLAVLTEVGTLCAQTGAKPLVLAANPNIIPLYQSALSVGYIRGGHPEEFNADTMIRFSTPELYSYAAFCAGTIRREKAGANIMIGSHAMDSLIIAEAGLDVGAMQIAGTTGASQAPYFIATCDYVFIGPEMYAVSAFLSQEPAQLGTIRGQDLVAWVLLALLVIGVILAQAKSDLLVKLMRL